MRVLLLTDNLNSGGAQRQLITLAIGLKTKGLDISFMVYNPGSYYDKVLGEHNIKPLKITKKSRSDVFFITRIFRTIRKENPDAIIAFLFAPSILAILSKLFVRKRINVIVSERSFADNTTRHITTKIARFLYRFANTVTINSQSQTNFIVSKYPSLSNKVVYIPNGINSQVFSSNPVRRNNNLVTNLLCVGHVNEVKNTKLVIKASHILLQNSQINFRVTWIGRHYDLTNRINRYYYECEEMIESLGLKNHWEWVSEANDIINHYHNSDLLVHASIGEGFPNAIMESLSCALPVIASSVNDNPLIIQNGINGFLFPSGNAQALASAIMQFCSLTKDQKKQLSFEARRTAELKFSLDGMISKYYNLL